MVYNYVATDVEIQVYITQMMMGILDGGLDYTKKESFELMMKRVDSGE